jgi:hypothetical protein
MRCDGFPTVEAAFAANEAADAVGDRLLHRRSGDVPVKDSPRDMLRICYGHRAQKSPPKRAS